MENSIGMYDFIKRAGMCFELLQDELSKKIFCARLALDFYPSSENVAQMVRLSEQQNWLHELEKHIPDIVHRMEENPKKLILYGTNVTGRMMAAWFQKKNIGFYGFCGRRAKEFPDGLMGKPVIAPDDLFRHPEDFYVILAVGEAIDEILGILRENHFPQDQILSRFRPAGEMDHQYFDFPALFHRGTAFIDGGCLDCRTAYLFVNWCSGEYSKIFAFEPDPVSYSICEKNILERKLENFHLVRAGLSDHTGTVHFRSALYGCSHIVEGGEETNVVAIPVTTVDSTVKDERIGFIKLDIEGAEFDALHGAKGVIVRDKPLLAISVYHRTGDMLAIMDYLRNLVPKYRFWLRHYSIGAADTVLYASVD